MAVEIHELEVIPRPAPATSSPAPATEDTHASAPQPDVELQIRRTTYRLHSRDHRLRAD
jgi:hypothetical protein